MEDGLLNDWRDWDGRMEDGGLGQGVTIREGDKKKVAFNCKEGHFKFMVMTFGLTNALATWQTMIQKVLTGIIGVCLFR